jgi:hypothetical protein
VYHDAEEGPTHEEGAGELRTPDRDRHATITASTRGMAGVATVAAAAAAVAKGEGQTPYSSAIAIAIDATDTAVLAAGVEQQPAFTPHAASPVESGAATPSLEAGGSTYVPSATLAAALSNTAALGGVSVLHSTTQMHVDKSLKHAEVPAPAVSLPPDPDRTDAYPRSFFPMAHDRLLGLGALRGTFDESRRRCVLRPCFRCVRVACGTRWGGKGLRGPHWCCCCCAFLALFLYFSVYQHARLILLLLVHCVVKWKTLAGCSHVVRVHQFLRFASLVWFCLHCRSLLCSCMASPAPTRQLPFHSSADHVVHSSPQKPGHGLLGLRSRCSFILPLLFALLRGRCDIMFA